MKLTVTRNQKVLYGVFGQLKDEAGNFIAVTLEHSYRQPDGTFISKVPDGRYICKRGQHRLTNMTNSFETFEITGVPGHTNILFHKGNSQNDSSGCLLLGEKLGTGCILESGIAFGHFLDMLVGVDEFEVVVESV